MEQNLKDGQRYLVTFNGGVDCVEANYIEEHKVFSFLSGSVSLNEAEKVEAVLSNNNRQRR